MFSNGLRSKFVFTCDNFNGRDGLYMVPFNDIFLSMATGVVVGLFEGGVLVGDNDRGNKNWAC